MPTIDVPEMVTPLVFDYANNSYIIPTAPALLPPHPPVPNPSPPPLPTKTHGKLLDEILGLGNTINDNENILPSIVKQKLKDLQDRGLLIYQNDQEKLSKKYYELPKHKTKEAVKIKVDFTEEIVTNNNNFNVGLLQVTDNHNSILLKGTQTHVVVIYAIHNNQKIVMGYLTSEKDKTIKLSDTQPFNFNDQEKKKKQYFAVLQEPLMITNADYLKELETITLPGDIIINQQEVGEIYVNQPHIKDIITQQLITQIIPTIKQQGHYLQEYDGKGLTLHEIDETLKAFDEEAELNARKSFKKYKENKNQLTSKDLTQWLKGQEQTLDKITFEILKNKIETHENIHKQT
jgi:hypothetical protein